MEQKSGQGLISLENLPLEFGLQFGPNGRSYMEGHLEVKIADDGRVWININGICFLRFIRKGITTQGTTGTCPQCQKQSQPFNRGQDICDICLRLEEAAT